MDLISCYFSAKNDEKNVFQSCCGVLLRGPVAGFCCGWNGNLTQVGENYVVTSMWYNGAIAPGGGASFSYCASKTGPSYLPAIVSAVSE